MQTGSGLAKEEIERMVEEARSHEEEDQRRRAEVETRNQADSLVYTTEKMLEENKDKIPQELKEEVEGKVATLKAALASNNAAGMQAAVADLSSAVQRVGQAVYSQAGGPSQTMDDGPTDGGPGAGGSPDDDQQGGGTVEGEFREV